MIQYPREYTLLETHRPNSAPLTTRAGRELFPSLHRAAVAFARTIVAAFAEGGKVFGYNCPPCVSHIYYGFVTPHIVEDPYFPELAPIIEDGQNFAHAQTLSTMQGDGGQGWYVPTPVTSYLMLLPCAEFTVPPGEGWYFDHAAVNLQEELPSPLVVKPGMAFSHLSVGGSVSLDSAGVPFLLVEIEAAPAQFFMTIPHPGTD